MDPAPEPAPASARASDPAPSPAPSPAVVRDALAGGSVVARLDRVAPLRLTGADRLDFLHGQVSHDVRGLPEGGATRALLLSVKGHALAAMLVARRRDDLYVAVEDGGGALVARSLRQHVIFDQVEIEDLSDRLVAFTVQGAGAEGALRTALGADAPPVGRFEHAPFLEARVLIVARDRSGAGGFDLHVLARDADALHAALAGAGALPAPADALEPFRLAAGLPTADAEAGEGVLPQEAGLEPLVSYRKGCYLGQEIMARIEARGTLRRGLARLLLDGVPAAGERDVRPAGEPGARPVGRLGGVAEHPDLGVVALAVLRRDLEPGAALEVGGARARYEPLPGG